MFRNHCLICNSSNLVRVINLGMHPFADTFIPASKLSESEPIYPLCCDLCRQCGQIQNACITDPEQRYTLYDYSYTSSGSSFARNHWEQYAKEVSQKLNLVKDSFIVEVGSNDGFLAEQLQKQGHRVLGVDPSEPMADLAKKRNIRTVVGLFNSAVGNNIEKQFGRADLIVANNVFNHSDTPLDFAQAASSLLGPNGTFVFESPYWCIGFKDRRFDQIYHEHISYFTVASVKKILEKAGLVVSDVELVDYHGGSVRVFAKRRDSAKKESPKVKEMIEKEVSLKVFDPRAYEDFMKYILARRNSFLKKIYDLKSQGKSIIGVGAPAKGNTLLNFYNLNHNVIDYVTDSSPYKYGKYTPLTRISIQKDEIFTDYDEVYALILSWNISSQIKKSLYHINKKIKFISPWENE